MEKKYCLLDENGEIYTLTNAADAFNELELEDAIAMYGVNCYYQRVHNDIIKLIEKGLILPNTKIYPQKEIQNTLNVFGELICNEIGEDGLKLLQQDINEDLNDIELIGDLTYNIMCQFDFKTHPFVIENLKRKDKDDE
jgi:hypothetical protein